MYAPMLTSCFSPAVSPDSAVGSPLYQSVPLSTYASFSLPSSPPGAVSCFTRPRFFLSASSG